MTITIFKTKDTFIFNTYYDAFVEDLKHNNIPNNIVVTKNNTILISKDSPYLCEILMICAHYVRIKFLNALLYKEKRGFVYAPIHDVTLIKYYYPETRKKCIEYTNYHALTQEFKDSEKIIGN
ncbi:MAG: hypothetical protein Q3988_06635 [Gemella sp.]|nr:hypothetical protein [Gemella sp.]